jgi:hypothetical protein
MFKIIMLALMVFAGSASATESPFDGVQVGRPADEAHHVDFYKTYHVLAYYKGKAFKAVFVAVNNNGQATYTTIDASGATKFTIKVESSFPVKVAVTFAHGNEKEEGSFIVGLQPGEWSDAKLGNFKMKMERCDDSVELSP